MGFINYRQPINGIAFNQEIKAFFDFYISNPFQTLLKVDNEFYSGFSNVGKFDYWNYSFDLMENVGTLFLGVMIFLSVYLFFKILTLIKSNNEWFNTHMKKISRLVVYKVYEYRLLNDIWVSTMGIFIIFTALNYMGMGGNLSTLLSFIFGVSSIATPIIIW